MRTSIFFLTSLSLLVLGGCAGPDSSSSPEAAEHEVKGKPPASEPSECVQNLPIEVWSYAAHLDLGQPVTSEGAAGSIYYEFTSGAIVRWSNVESKVSEVRVIAKDGPTKGEVSDLPIAVAAAADANGFGELVSEEGAAGSIYYEFARGLVRWSNVSSKVSEVKRTDGSTAKPKAPLTATKQASEVCLDSMPAPVWSIAAHLDLGPALSSDGAAGSLYFEFANGSVIRWSNVESQVSDVQIVAPEGPTEGEPESIPLDVVDAAAKKGFGALLSSEGAAGSMYYTFDRGVVRWSNMDSKVISATPK